MRDRGFRLERLLPIACLVAAGVLFASEFMVAFEFTPPGAEALADQTAHDRHSYAQAVLAVAAVAALVAALATGSKPAAGAVAACGVLALLIFLLLDLPDAGNVGTLDDSRQSFATAEAVPQPGFWLQLLGALGVALTGAAMATLSSDQIRSLRPGGGRRSAETRTSGAERAQPSLPDASASPDGSPESPASLPGARPRATPERRSAPPRDYQR